MLYVFEDLEKINDTIYQKMLGELSPQRLKKAESYKQPHSRKQCAAVYLLLRYALMTEYHITTEESKVEFDYIENGKPVLKNYREIFFNMSHCIYGAACALSCREVGVDIQDIRPFRAATLERIASNAERESVLNDVQPERAFCRLWSMKECLSKLSGKGLATDFSKLKVNTNLSVWEDEKYILTCSENLQRVNLTWEQFDSFFGLSVR